MKRLTLFFLLISFSLGAQTQDYKLDPATSNAIPTFHGTVLLIKGKARRFNKENPEGVILEKGQRLFVGDKIFTNPSSTIKFQMTDETMIALGSNSSFEIQKYDFKDRDHRQAIYVLLKGQLRSTVHRQAKAGDLEFHTPSIAMGVRGTEFLTNELEKKSQVALLSGKLEIKNLTDKKDHELNEKQLFESVKEKVDIQTISDAELKRLKASHMIEEKEFKPFLDLPEFAPLPQEQKNDLSFNEVQTSTKTFPQEDQWKKVLEQLNRQILENRN